MALRLRGGVLGGGAGKMPGESDPILGSQEDMPGPDLGPSPSPSPSKPGVPVFSQGSTGPAEQYGMQQPKPFGGMPGGTAGPGPGTFPTPPSPMAPSPADAQAGGSVSQPPQPFQPMPSIGAAGLSSPSKRLFGGARGLTGGGLGDVQDPNNLNASDPITSLIQSLLQRNPGLGGSGGGFGGA